MVSITAGQRSVNILDIYHYYPPHDCDVDALWSHDRGIFNIFIRNIDDWIEGCYNPVYAIQTRSQRFMLRLEGRNGHSV